MRVVFAGTPDAALPSLQRLIDSPHHEVVAIISRPDARSGRGRVLQPSPVAVVARELSIPLLQPSSARDPQFVDMLTEIDPDVCAIVAYGALLPPLVLEIPRHGWINLHFSLLPNWRGAAPVQHAIWAGDDVTGATTFRLDEGMDTGPVFGTVALGISRTTTAGELLAELAHVGGELLATTLDGVQAGTLDPVPQSTDGVSYAPKLTRDDARITWSVPAYVVSRRIRACTPAPGAWAEIKGQRVKIGPVEVGESTDVLAAGELRADSRNVWVGTSTAPVRLGAVTPAGKKSMDAADWIRGQGPNSGEYFD